MPEQLFLPGFGSASHPTDRVFLATLPPLVVFPTINHVTCNACAQHGLYGRPIAPNRLHASLQHVGDYVGLPKAIAKLRDALPRELPFPPFEVTFDRVMSFSNRRKKHPFVMCGNEGVTRLKYFQHELGIILNRAGVKLHLSTHYTPHVTLLYDQRTVAEQTIEPVTWTVNDFVLVHSFLGQARYEILECWPLCG